MIIYIMYIVIGVAFAFEGVLEENKR